MNILVVDDSAIVRRVLKNVLNRYFDEPTIYEAENGIQAMDVMKTKEVNLMLLDWNMPEMNGEQVVDAVRANKEWNSTRIIMATTEGGKQQVIKMIKKGVNGYMVKPFQEESIFKTLDTVTARMKR